MAHRMSLVVCRRKRSDGVFGPGAPRFYYVG